MSLSILAEPAPMKPNITYGAFHPQHLVILENPDRSSTSHRWWGLGMQAGLGAAFEHRFNQDTSHLHGVPLDHPGYLDLLREYATGEDGRYNRDPITPLHDVLAGKVPHEGFQTRTNGDVLFQNHWIRVHHAENFTPMQSHTSIHTRDSTNNHLYEHGKDPNTMYRRYRTSGNYWDAVGHDGPTPPPPHLEHLISVLNAMREAHKAGDPHPLKQWLLHQSPVRLREYLQGGTLR